MAKVKFENSKIIASPYRGAMNASVGCEVKHFKKPKWLIKLLKGVPFIGMGGWLDHWGTVETAKGDLFVSEPYYLGPDELKDLIAFCTKYGLDFDIIAESFWYPTHTHCG